MNNRENWLSLARRTGYEKVPVYFNLCPALEEYFKKNICADGDYDSYFGIETVCIPPCRTNAAPQSAFVKYYPYQLKENTFIDSWGVAHEPGSKAAAHMTRMRSPMAGFDNISQMETYEFPTLDDSNNQERMEQVQALKAQDRITVGSMECTIWETAWYMRSMEQLMMDMMTDDPMAEFLLNKVTETSVYQAENFAKVGVDVIKLGDDIGMQHNIMMSTDLYRKWLKPRLQRVISAVKSVNPDVLIQYHSCGCVVDFIPDLIEVGVDILNPVQPECMSFEKIHAAYGDRLSFNGTIGTQTVMPFGTPEEVYETVHRNLEIAGAKGGLFPAPTHLLEPEVPWENIEAYVQACRDWRSR